MHDMSAYFFGEQTEKMRPIFFLTVGFFAWLNPGYADSLNQDQWTTSPSTEQLALYTQLFSYSTLDELQTAYLTTDSIELAVRDLKVEQKLGTEFEINKTSDSSLLNKQKVIAYENAVINTLQFTKLNIEFPTESELRVSYDSTSGTYTINPFAIVDYYFLRADQSGTSQPISLVYESIKQQTSEPLLFARDVNLPSSVTSGTVQIQPGKFNAELEEQAFHLPLSTPHPFNGKYGWYILSVRERVATTQPLSFSKARSQVLARLSEERRQQQIKTLTELVKSKFPAQLRDSASFEERMQTSSTNVIAIVDSTSITMETLIDFSSQNRIEISPQTFNAQRDELILRKQLIAYAKKEKLTETRFFNETYNMLLFKALAEIAISEKVDSINHEPDINEIKKIFKTTPYNHPPQYHVYDIFTSGPKLSNTTSKAEVYLAEEKIQKRLIAFKNQIEQYGFNPKDFPSYDKTYGPFVVQDMGFAPQGPRGYLLDISTQNLKPGEFSNVVKGNDGFHFYYLADKTPEKPMSFEEALPLIAKTQTSGNKEKVRHALIQREFMQVSTQVIDSEAQHILLDKQASKRAVQKLIER